jgi:phage shock protein PspC (stress-responsive transcriptional regulator)
MTTSTAATDSTGLCRPLEGRMLGGVCEGVARHFDLDVALVRLAVAVLTVCGGIGLPLYLAGWLLIPEEHASVPLATELLDRMRG